MADIASRDSDPSKMDNANPAGRSAFFEDSPLQTTASNASVPGSFVRKLLLEAAKALRNLRDAESIREQVFQLIFSLTPADRAAILIDDSLSGRNRDGEPTPVPVNRAQSLCRPSNIPCTSSTWESEDSHHRNPSEDSFSSRKCSDAWRIACSKSGCSNSLMLGGAPSSASGWRRTAPSA